MRMSLSKGLWVAAGGVLAASVLMACTANGAADRATAEPDKIGPTCLDAQRTGRFHVVDEHTLLVYDRSDNAYKLDIGGPCRSMTDMSQFGFVFSGTTQICRAHDAQLLYSQTGERPVQCLINGVTPITRAEADQLDKG